jgi:hypothetical protein
MEGMMIQQFRVYAVLPCSDIVRAKTWYAQCLGAEPNHEDPGGAWYECANGTFVLTPSPNAGTAKNTAVSFQVTGIERVMADLRERGVRFEDYDMPEFKTQNGLFAMGPYRAAWFKDSEDNILELSEVLRPA